MIQEAISLGFNLYGLTFHVGSQVYSSTMHVKAIKEAAALIEKLKESSIEIHCLDIGGGFPINYEDNVDEEIDIDAFCAPIREALLLLPP